MKFEMSRAWDDAMGLLRGNRDLLLVVAGVFFLLPSLVVAIIFAEQHAQAMELMTAILSGEASPDNPEVLMKSEIGTWMIVGLTALIVQMVGYMALLALMDARSKPTVGQAIGRGFKGLLPLIGAVLLFYLGAILLMLLVGLVLGLLVALIAGAIGLVAGTSAATVVVVTLAFVIYVVIIAGTVYLMSRLSLVLPAIALGGIANPVKTYRHSWALTRGNGWRLTGFYALLFIAYMVISMVLFGIMFGFGSMAISNSQASGLIFGLASGIIGAVVSVIFSAILAAVYGQLRGITSEAVSEAFE